MDDADKRKKQKVSRRHAKAHKGLFRPKNREKYRGDASNCTYRSSWELRLMRYFDGHPDVLEWGSEICVIPYDNPLTGKISRYFTDFWIKRRDASGKINTIVIEVKPFHETMPPRTDGKSKRRLVEEAQTYEVNMAKWDAAQKYCKEMGWKFLIMTEREIYGKKVSR